jgi:hypothetical protein
MNKAVIIWRGRFGGQDNHYGKTLIRDVTADAALVTLIGVLDGLTSANVAKRSFNAVNEVLDEAPATGGDMDAKLVIVMKDTATDLPTKLSIPAPLDADFEETTQGLRLTAALLASTVTAVNTATGRTLTGLYGYYAHKV